MSDEEKPTPSERPSRASTVKPPAPRPSPKREPLRIVDGERGGVIVAPVASDRPTPRSTVIPRLPVPMTLSGMRPQLQTLIFHGAPPPAPMVPRASPRPPPVPLSTIAPPPLLPRAGDESVLEVNSAELLAADDLREDEDDAIDDERPTPFQPGVARTDRPPPMSTREAARRLRDRRPLAIGGAIAAACALSIALVAVSQHATRAPVVAMLPAPTAPSATVAAPSAPVATPRAPGTCKVGGKSKLLARRAIVRGGIEATAFDDRVAFAVLTSQRTGTAYAMDAATLAVHDSAKLASSDPLRRVVPSLIDDAPVDVLGDTGSLRTLPDAEGESLVGTRDGFVVWGPRDDATPTARLWRLPWPAQIEAPRIATLGTSGDRAVVFRRSGAIWIGSFHGAHTTSDLVKLSTASLVGAPVVDASGDQAIVAWAQRSAPDAPWGIRWVRWTPNGGPGTAHELALPAGGPGERAMAPSVAATGGGRFLLAWTEAGHGRNQVRAQAFDANDRPLGDALDVSPRADVAGQEQIALADGEAGTAGAIAYLVSRRGSFELRATSIDCAR